MGRALRTVDNSLAYGHPHLYSKSGSATILQDVTMASMSGTLAQLGILSHYAHEVFQDLFNASKELYERVDRAQTRSMRLVEQLNDISLNTNAMDGSAGISNKANLVEEPDGIAFNESTMPRALRERYSSAEVHETPDLSSVDALLPEEEKAKHGPCAHKYSYPGLFLDQWAAEEMKRISTLKEKKAEKKAGRKEKKRIKEASLNERLKTEDLQRRRAAIKGPSKWRDRYHLDDPEAKTSAQLGQTPPPALSKGAGGVSQITMRTERSMSSASDRPQSLKQRVSQSSPSPLSSAKLETDRPKGTAMPTPPPKPPKATPTATTKPPPPPPPPVMPPNMHGDVEEDEDYDAATESSAGPGSVRRSASRSESTIVEQSVDDDYSTAPAHKESQEYAKFFKMLNMGIPKPAVQQKMRADGLDPAVLDDESDDEDTPSAPRHAPSPPRNEPAAPADESPMPPRPRAASGLLGAIQQGATLKKVEPVVRSTSSSSNKNDLLSAIKAGTKLRKRDPSEDAPPPPKPNPGGLFGAVDKILSLREKIEIDTESDDSDDDWGVDDD